MDHGNQAIRMKFQKGCIVSLCTSILTVTLCSLVLALPGWAGEGKHRHGQNSEKHLKKLTKKLGLTEEQQVKIKPILERKAQQLQELHQQMKEVRQQTRSQIESGLTPEQVEAFKELREKRKERRKGHKEKHEKHQKKEHKKGKHDHHDDDKDEG